MGMTQIDLNLKVLETNSLFMSTQFYAKVISGYLDYLQKAACISTAVRYILSGKHRVKISGNLPQIAIEEIKAILNILCERNMLHF